MGWGGVTAVRLIRSDRIQDTGAVMATLKPDRSLEEHRPLGNQWIAADIYSFLYTGFCKFIIHTRPPSHDALPKLSCLFGGIFCTYASNNMIFLAPLYIFRFPENYLYKLLK